MAARPVRRLSRVGEALTSRRDTPGAVQQYARCLHPCEGPADSDQQKTRRQVDLAAGLYKVGRRLLKRAIAREIFRLLTRPIPIDDYRDLRPARQAKNITLATVATHLGVPIITVSRLERGCQRNNTLATNYRRWLTAA